MTLDVTVPSQFVGDAAPIIGRQMWKCFGDLIGRTTLGMLPDEVQDLEIGAEGEVHSSPSVSTSLIVMDEYSTL